MLLVLILPQQGIKSTLCVCAMGGFAGLDSSLDRCVGRVPPPSDLPCLHPPTAAWDVCFSGCVCSVTSYSHEILASEHAGRSGCQMTFSALPLDALRPGDVGVLARAVRRSEERPGRLIDRLKTVTRCSIIAPTLRFSQKNFHT